MQGRAAPLVGALMVSAIGALLLLLVEFGGWEYSVAYTEGLRLDRFGSVWVFENALYFMLLAPIIALLGGVAVVSYLGVRGDRRAEGLLGYALSASVAALVALVAYAIAFSFVMLSEEPDDWWLNAGFYGGTIGALLAIVFLHLARRAGDPTGDESR